MRDLQKYSRKDPHPNIEFDLSKTVDWESLFFGVVMGFALAVLVLLE